MKWMMRHQQLLLILLAVTAGIMGGAAIPLALSRVGN